MFRQQGSGMGPPLRLQRRLGGRAHASGRAEVPRRTACLTARNPPDPPFGGGPTDGEDPGGDRDRLAVMHGANDPFAQINRICFPASSITARSSTPGTALEPPLATRLRGQSRSRAEHQQTAAARCRGRSR